MLKIKTFPCISYSGIVPTKGRNISTNYIVRKQNETNTP